MSKWFFVILPFIAFFNALADSSLGLVRISELEAFDEGNFGPQVSSSPFVDVIQGVCDRKDQNGDGDKTDPEDVVLESFYDTILGATIRNEMNLPITIRRFSYSLRNAGSGRRFRSRALAPLQEATIPSRSQKELFFLFIKALDGVKTLTGSNSPIGVDLGFQNVSVRLRGITAAGRTVTLRGRTALSFGDFNRCASKAGLR